MKSAMFHRRRAERFAQLLDEADGARRHHVRSRLDAQLAELVAIGHQTSALRSPVELDPEFRVGLRAMLIATAEREGIGRTARERPVPGTARAGHRATAGGATSRARARGAVIVGVAAGAIAVSGMSAASENAVPGDALYGVKRSTERAQLALTNSEVNRGRLYLDFAHTRVAEATAVRRDAKGFAAVLDDMDADTRHGVKLLTTSAVLRRDPGALEPVSSFVAVQRLELGDLLDRVSPQNRARTLESLALLDTITKRADSLRAALSCASSPTTGADRLGPMPRQCTVDGSAEPNGGGSDQPGADKGRGRDGASPGDPGTGTGPQSNPGAERRATPGPGTPGADPAAPANPNVTKDDGLLNDVGRALGGILG